MRVLRVDPGPVIEVDVADLYGPNTTNRTRADGKPWVAVSMIASADGSTVLAGRSGGLGNDADRAVLVAMRSAADVVMVGAGTVRAEGYGPPKRDDLRLAVVTARGALDWDAPLFASGRALVIMPEDAAVTPPASVAVIRSGTTTVDIAGAMSQLQARFGAAVVVCEGGPSLNGQVLAAGLVDELCLTVAPFLAGGQGARIVAGAPEVAQRMRRVHTALADDWTFLRFEARPTAEPREQES